mgnify:CR=1 FL=1
MPPDDGRFVIRIAPRFAGPSYDIESLRARIEATPPEEFSITVRADAIQRFITAPTPTTCVRLGLTAAGAARLRDDAAARAISGHGTHRLESDLDGMLFVVEFDGQRLFEGQVWFAMGAAAFDTPVMHARDEPAPGELALAPSQGLWTTLGPGGRSPIDHRVLREYFRARGLYEEHRRCEPR